MDVGYRASGKGIRFVNGRLESGVSTMNSYDKTMKFNFPEESMEQEVKQVMLHVHKALEDKGYNPINQIVGYLLSGDPAYIPRHYEARNLIRKLERDEILEELVKFYIRENGGKTN